MGAKALSVGAEDCSDFPDCHCAFRPGTIYCPTRTVLVDEVLNKMLNKWVFRNALANFEETKCGLRPKDRKLDRTASGIKRRLIWQKLAWSSNAIQGPAS